MSSIDTLCRDVEHGTERERLEALRELIEILENGDKEIAIDAMRGILAGMLREIRMMG